jgi:hypothetical protein
MPVINSIKIHYSIILHVRLSVSVGQRSDTTGNKLRAEIRSPDLKNVSSETENFSPDSVFPAYQFYFISRDMNL